MNFTEEEIEFMQRLRTKKMGYGNIARRLETVYRKKGFSGKASIGDP